MGQHRRAHRISWKDAPAPRRQSVPSTAAAQSARIASWGPSARDFGFCNDGPLQKILSCCITIVVWQFLKQRTWHPHDWRGPSKRKQLESPYIEGPAFANRHRHRHDTRNSPQQPPRVCDRRLAGVEVEASASQSLLHGPSDWVRDFT